MQDLDFPRGAVAGMDLDRAVVRANRGRRLPALAAVPEVQDIGLHRVQHAVFARLLEPGLLRRLQVLEPVEEIPPLRPERRQEAVACL